MSRLGTAGRFRGRAGLVAVSILLVAFVLGALPAEASTHAGNDGKTKKLDLSGVTLKVGYGVVRDTSTQDVRLASGAFDNTPYEIKWVPFQSGSLEALSGGAVDLVVDTLALNAILADGNAKAPWTRANAPYHAVAASVAPPEAGAVIGVHPGSGIKKVADLKGKKVAYVPGGVSQLYWAIAARDAKLKPGDIEEVELPVAESRAAFLSGAVDALVGQHRTFLPMISDGSATVIASSNGAAPEYRLTFVRPGYLDDKAQAAAVGDFVSRVARSKQWLAKHYPEAADIYQRAAKVEPADALAGVKEMPATVLPLDDQLAKALQSQSKIFRDTGVTTSNPKISVIFDRRYETG